jgi:hypothetical protein
MCMDTVGWVDAFGDGCDWYETNDSLGCPFFGHLWGSMGEADDNCCYCSDNNVSVIFEIIP